MRGVRRLAVLRNLSLMMELGSIALLMIMRLSLNLHLSGLNRWDSRYIMQNVQANYLVWF